jgi:PleD family two-component response regulator
LEEFDWSTIHVGVNLTASFGLATTGDAREISVLMRSADEQLLQAKRTGKNRVLCSSADVLTPADEATT